MAVLLGLKKTSNLRKFLFWIYALRFEFIEHQILDLDKGHEYEKDPNFTRGNIAIFAVLRHVLIDLLLS